VAIKKIKLFNVLFDALTMNETVSLVEKQINENMGVHLLGVNADKILAMEKNASLRKIVNDADIINADGASVVLASRFLKEPLPERIAGIDLMQELLSVANKKGYSVYFIGARKSVVDKMVDKFKYEYPQLRIVGYRDGYFEKKDWKIIASEVRNSKSDLVFIGITSPMKEYFIDFLLKQNVKSVLMGVGGSFDVLSGNIKRAPIWMQRVNLEWLFRLAQEPHRLFRRYFVGNIKFIIRVFSEKILH